MKIVADQNIPLLNELFADLGDIYTLPGRTMVAKDIADADILLVRSITRVNANLLDKSRVKFVGSCTIGTDHLDTDYLRQHNIPWASAPGCNANAVVQYVFSAMAALQPQWLQKTVGIIGCGNIGGRLYKRLNALGVSCRVYDPFLSRNDCGDLTDLDDVLQSDVITCHTPLTASGPYPTYHLLSEPQLKSIRPGSLLINSGRGAVIDNVVLLSLLAEKTIKTTLDVWENEPHINRPLLDKVSLGTPHIAGYSVEGKEQGSWMIYEAVCKFLNMPIDKTKQRYLTSDSCRLSTIKNDLAREDKLNQLLLTCYDIRKDDVVLRDELDFDWLRKNYLSRRENTYFRLPDDQDSWLRQQFTIIAG